jgi:hypothetical protein
MHDTWMRIGRFWTNGEHFLAVDSALRSAWRGYGNDDYEKLILTLSGETGGVPVGAGRAALVGDGTVRDDSWIEAFQTRTGLVAFVQVSYASGRSLNAGMCRGRTMLKCFRSTVATSAA